MKLYKAFVWDKRNKKYVTIESREDNKSTFIDSLRKNGYRVNPIKVKEADVFDYIMKHTNCNSWDWKEIKKVPTELTKQETKYMENDVQTVNALIEDSVNFNYEVIEFDEIESKRLKLQQRAGFHVHYNCFNVNHYTVNGKKSCGYIFDGKAGDYEKKQARIISFNRRVSFTDIRNIQYGFTLIIDAFYLGVSIHITPERKGETHIAVINADGTQACEHVFKNVIECKKWCYHLGSVRCDNGI